MRTHASTRGRMRALSVVLVMGVVFGSAGLAAGEPPPEPAVVDRGVLVLELGDVDQLRHVAPDGTTLATQGITAQGCKVTLDTSGDILATLSPTSAGVVGLFADGIGVKTGGGKGGNGQPCGQANGVDEGLVLELAGDLAGYEIDFAQLDIEGKFSVLVDFELYLDGVKIADGTPLATGDLSDSGPDSADGDNYRHDPEEGVTVDVRYDRIDITVNEATPSGAFSLEGGADGTVAGSLGFVGSAFQLVEEFAGIIDCGEGTFTVGDGVSSAEATFVRADDDDKNQNPCTELIGYDLESLVGAQDQTVVFQFETEEAPAWYGTIVWAPEPAAIPIPATELDFDDDGNSDGALAWCDGFAGIDASTGKLRPVMPDGESWCLIEQMSTLLGDGTMQVTQMIYGQSDPGFARPK